MPVQDVINAPKEPIIEDIEDEDEDEDEDEKLMGAFIFRDMDEFIRGSAFIPVVCNYNRSKNNISVS